MLTRRGAIAALAVAFLAVFVTGSQSEAFRMRREIEVGSILVQITAGDASQLVGVALLPVGGSYQFPKLTTSDTSVTVPYFAIQVDVDDDRVLPNVRGMDTFVAMTNTAAATGKSVTVSVTFRRADGTPVPSAENPVTATIAPGQTVIVSAASFLAP